MGVLLVPPDSDTGLKLRAFIDAVLAIAWSGLPDGSLDFVNQQFRDYTGLSSDQLTGWEWKSVVHPDDIPQLETWWQELRQSQDAGTTEKRLRRFDGAYRWFRIAAAPLYDEQGKLVRWCGINTDIHDLKRSEEKLRKDAEESRLRRVIDTIPTLAWCNLPDGSNEFLNKRWHDYTGLSVDESHGWGWQVAFHPEDLPPLMDKWRKMLVSGQPDEIEARLRRHDGVYRWFLIRADPFRDEAGKIVRWYGTSTDIDDRKRAERKLQQDEAELRTLSDAIRQVIVVLAPDGTTLYANRVAQQQTGLTPEERKTKGSFLALVHPDDIDRLRDRRRARLLEGIPFELEMRLLLQSGEYRWHLFQYNPLKDEHGQTTRWYVTGTDIDDRKRTEERLQNENLALREEIDLSSMFEEIIGSSEALRKVLLEVAKVAPTDSTVLILGETGTGKELIARAIHKRSKRSGRAFICVNCAAIPASLVASELFGHEKGAFTGALQRRAGHFEAADGGTVFLDEIGELSLETQISLLRVLQEREFQRVGNSRPISVDVRVLAATNRDLDAAVAAGTFRQDLLYRLNVFPVRVPPLRERKNDIPVLVQYLVEQFARRAGKRITEIQKNTLNLLQAYDWPGNIRELQNVIERAVVLCDGKTLSVDETWLQRRSNQQARPTVSPVSVLADDRKELAHRELRAIEAALAECQGRVSGPHGAAAKLGIPRQTLDSKIQSFGIDKRRFKALSRSRHPA